MKLEFSYVVKKRGISITTKPVMALIQAGKGQQACWEMIVISDDLQAFIDSGDTAENVVLFWPVIRDMEGKLAKELHEAFVHRLKTGNPIKKAFDGLTNLASTCQSELFEAYKKSSQQKILLDKLKIIHSCEQTIKKKIKHFRRHGN